MHFLTLLEHAENAVLVFFGQAVLVAILLELLRGIDEQHTVVGTCTLAQHDDADGYAHTKEEIRRQLDDGVHIVVLDEPVADGALLASTIEHTGKLHDGSRAALRERAQHVERESKVGSRVRGQHTGAAVAVVVDEQRVLASFPRDAVRGIRYDGIERLEVSVPWIQQRVAQLDVES